MPENSHWKMANYGILSAVLVCMVISSMAQNITDSTNTINTIDEALLSRGHDLNESLDNRSTGMIGALKASETAFNPSPPNTQVRLIFIHHSTGENWLADDNGGLGIALRDNNYFASDTNYGWGPDSIGDLTDIGQWWLWFRGPDTNKYMSALYAESDNHCEYSRLPDNPGGQNEMVMFKSCFPNSALKGNPDDPVPSIENNPLRGLDSGSEYHTVANAKGIYIDLLEYFRIHQEKLFIVITAPPLSDPEYSSNARAFNQWLVNDWLKDYPYNNVFVFDFYNVLTTNDGNPNANDLDRETGNHHRWWNGLMQHKIDGDNDPNPNILEYPSDDDHPNVAGNRKATAELLPLLNIAYNRWKSTPVNKPTPIYRMWSPAQTDHFYTTDYNEYSTTAVNYGYRQEGILGYLYGSPQPGTVPIYRMFSPSQTDHFYTTDYDEYSTTAVVFGYQQEGILGYIYSSNQPGSTPIYRMWSSYQTDHFLTADYNEYSTTAVNYGYAHEGVLGYGATP